MQKRILDILQNTQKVIIGKERVTKLLLTALLADGHVLLEDVPGTGKTRLAKALAASLGIEFGRIQFTPDMLPADITGLHIYDRESGKFVLNKGPVFTNILLADEINRATPRTQAGLLECMEERQVTIDGKTQKLEPPFFVVATENPVETAGTFPSSGSADGQISDEAVHGAAYERRRGADPGYVYDGGSVKEADSGDRSGDP
ncbi:MAG: AAA family ATPase [Gallintestinimicrobium sp.]